MAKVGNFAVHGPGIEALETFGVWIVAGGILVPMLIYIVLLGGGEPTGTVGVGEVTAVLVMVLTVVSS